MGASGYPIPIQDYIQGIPPLFIDPFFPGGVNLGVNTPEGLYPLTGIKDLTFDVSAARGLTILDNAITAAFGQLNATSVNVFGYSQSAVIASMEMKALDPTNTPSSIPLNFTLVGNPSNPNGGLLARFPDWPCRAWGWTCSASRRRTTRSKPTSSPSNTTVSATSRNTRSTWSRMSTHSWASSSCTATTRSCRARN